MLNGGHHFTALITLEPLVLNKSVTRKESSPVKVWCLPEEKFLIQEIAKKHGLSASSYLRNLGVGHPVESSLDQHAILELAKINGDLGRLGGLLKMWLTNDERLRFSQGIQVEGILLTTLGKIGDLQAELANKLSRL